MSGCAYIAYEQFLSLTTHGTLNIYLLTYLLNCYLYYIA